MQFGLKEFSKSYNVKHTYTKMIHIYTHKSNRKCCLASKQFHNATLIKHTYIREIGNTEA